MPPNKIAQNFLDYVNSTGSPYHSVKGLTELLHEHHFQALDEKSTWNLVKGGKYYVVRNQTSVMAFTIGKHFNRNNSGFLCAVGHTDSPVLHLRPHSHMNKQGYFHLSVECYGGGLWGTWFDRGLGVAGKVIYKKPQDSGDSEDHVETLVHIKKPIAIIPSLPIHLRAVSERLNNPINLETNIHPIVASAYKQEFQNHANSHISPILLKALAKEIQCQEEDIVDVDLCLMDATESRFCGFEDEFVESPRIDNLVSTWTIFSSLSQNSNDLCQGEDIYVAVGFDNEEIGSMSWTGACSNFLQTTLERTISALGFSNSMAEYFSRSFLISSDMGHCFHPNYPEKYQSDHAIHMNKGVAFKLNTNLKYTTAMSGIGLFKMIAQKNNIPIQTFVVKNDSPCGSTVGPILSSNLGMKSIDIGVPQWAMHSIRETCGSADIEHHQNFITAFYKDYQWAQKHYKSI